MLTLPDLRPASTRPEPLAWAECGAMALTGPAHGRPRLSPGPLATRARTVLERLRERVDDPAALPRDGALLLGERAAWLGLGRRGRTAPGGSCRLLPTADGWLALNLARPDDVALLPAWLEATPPDGTRDAPWRFVATRVSSRRAAELVARGRMMGLALARAERPAPEPPPWVRVGRPGTPRTRTRDRAPRVLDLGSLWAGPLATRLLAAAGALVWKVESTERPDGTRRGPAGFHDALNAGKASVALDLATPRGREQLRGLVAAADVVVESGRPRALAQLGLEPDLLLAEHPGLSWVSITGHGREGPAADWVAFGDDAAVGAGLARATGDGAAPLFCGDAIADPLTGLHAALAAWVSWQEGGGHRLELNLRDVAAHAAHGDGDAPPARLERNDGAAYVVCDGARARVAPPRTLRARGTARPLGADTAAVLGEAGVSC